MAPTPEKSSRTEQLILQFLEQHRSFTMTMLEKHVDSHVAYAAGGVYRVLLKMRKRGRIDYHFAGGQYHILQVWGDQ